MPFLMNGKKCLDLFDMKYLKRRDKIWLENLIFYQAEIFCKNITACEGILVVEDEGLLGKLAEVYNLIFSQENKKFLEDDIEESRIIRKKFLKEYKEEKNKNPTLNGFFLNPK